MFDITVEGVAHLHCIHTTIWCVHEARPRKYHHAIVARYSEATRVIEALPSFVTYFNATIHGMLYYILQVSDNEPHRAYRISVVDSTDKPAIAAIIDSPGYTNIGTYADVDKLMETVQPYLQLEDTK